MASSFADRDRDNEAMAKCHALGLHPISNPLGEHGHHANEPVSPDDHAIGLALAYFIGTVFEDKSDPAIYKGFRYKDSLRYNHSSVELWERVARALRFHGLRIADMPHHAAELEAFESR